MRILNHEQMPTIVFACNVLHAKMLAAMLTVDDIPNSLVLGDMDPVKRKAAIDNLRIEHLKLISLSIMMFLLRVLIQPILVYLLPDLQNQLYCIVR